MKPGPVKQRKLKADGLDWTRACAPSAPLYECRATRRVEFADTDMAGIMHFSNYFRFMETVETAFMRSLGFSIELARSGLAVCLPRVHVECDYFAPLRFDDEVHIHLLVERKGARTLTYQIRFYRVGPQPGTLSPGGNPWPPEIASREEVARGRVVAVCAQRSEDGAMKAVPLPRALSERIAEAPARLLQQPPVRPAAADEPVAERTKAVTQNGKAARHPRRSTAGG